MEIGHPLLKVMWKSRPFLAQLNFRLQDWDSKIVKIRGDIKKAIENGAKTPEEVMEVTGAGSVCGACIDEVKSIVEKLSAK